MALPSAGATDCSSGLSNRIFNNFRYDNPWQALQSGVAATPNATLCCPTIPAGFGFKCTAITTGITGGAEPTWPTTIGNTVVDGGVTWTCQDIASPSAKTHSPAGSFSYSMSAADLDGFRVLAYNQARAIADELTVGDYCAMAANTGAGQSIPGTSTHTIVVYGTVERDTDSAYNSSTGRYTIPAGKGGDYMVTGSWAFSGATTGQSFCTIFKNGATQSRQSGATGLAALQTIAIAAMLSLSAGDVIDIRAFQGSGAAATLSTFPSLCFFTVARVLGS